MMMFFSERKKLSEEYEKWVSENKDVLDCPLTVISWLVAEGYVGKTKVADLETKLAESEKRLVNCVDFDTWQKTAKENKQLKQQLAEKDKAIENWQTMYQSVMQSSHNGIEEDKRLREQLKEKENEYQSFKKIADENVNYLKNRILEETRNYNQDKISFAVEQLEKVKEELEFTSNNNEWITARDDRILNGICDFIDNQIKAIKEMK